MPCTLLLILDGWGIAPEGEGNCVKSAATPFLDSLLDTYPNTQLQCSGRAVGLPDGFMGNSEVGHMNIGAGRIVYQDMTRIDMAIEDGSLESNRTLDELAAQVKAGSGRLHLMGLISDGGVHSHLNHVYAMLRFAKKQQIPEVIVHCFMDGRDTPPSSGKEFVRQLCACMEQENVGRVGVVSGRFYAMDRDKRYERNEIAWRALVDGDAPRCEDALDGIQAAYDAGETDEFIKPFLVGEEDSTVQDGDGIFFFNFRADRARQICRAFFDKNFDGFKRTRIPELSGFATMTRYESAFPMPVAFPPQEYQNTLGEVVSRSGCKQLRIAETEKYAHVTYFFNCGREESFENEDRVLVPSPREVATYDEKPQMSVDEVADKLVERLDDYDLAVCNFANLDMVGHTGIIDAAQKACVAVDACVDRVVGAVLARGGRVLLTADHGNAEEMIGPDGGPQTSHSTNPVPLVYIESGSKNAELNPGVLGDIAPTILDLMNVKQPAEMTGSSLLKK